MERFVGLGNFTFLFKRETFWMVVQQSCIFAITAVIFKALIGFIVAHFVHNIPTKGQRKWRGMLLVPWVIPPAMSALAWLWLFDPSYSAFNWILALFGIGPVPWTGDANWARFSVILVNVWIGAPFFMIMYLAALKSVPEQLYEAAAIDGANWWQRMWYVTLPMMRNIIAITALFSLIVTFANFDIVRILTAGGPIDQTHVFATWSFWLGIQGSDIPLGAARVAVHGADPGRRRRLHPARHQPARERSMTIAADARQRRQRRAPRYGSMSRDRRWALRWSYFFLVLFAIFFLTPPIYMLITSLKTSAEISAATNPWWVYQPDARQLRRAARLVAVSDLLPQLGARLGLRRHHHHADPRAGGVCAVAHEVLGLGDARDRRLPHLPDPGDAAVHPAVQDVRGVQRVDRHPADQSLVGAADHLSDADRAVLHLDHDRLFRLDPEGARRGGADGRRQLPADPDARVHSRWRCPA